MTKMIKFTLLSFFFHSNYVSLAMEDQLFVKTIMKQEMALKQLRYNITYNPDVLTKQNSIKKY